MQYPGRRLLLEQAEGVRVYNIILMQWSEEQRSALVRLRLLVGCGAADKKWRKQTKNSRLRRFVLQELVDTEASYIADLETMENGMQRPLLERGLISEKENVLLFSYLKPILSLSRDMHACVAAALRSWHPHRTLIGEQLIALNQFFKIYREYCQQFLKAQSLGIFKRLKDSPEGAAILATLKLDFESYSIKPVQRPPKYQLLLREYLKGLWPGHPDYAAVEKATEKYHLVNDDNNRAIEKYEKSEAMIKLDRRFSNVISNHTPRHFLREFACRCLNFPCAAHALTDLLLLVQRYEGFEAEYRRIYLDAHSYVLPRPHFKHFANVVFVCGAALTAHLHFERPDAAEQFHEELDKIIQNLRDSDEERRARFRKETRKRNPGRLRVLRYEEAERGVTYRPKLQITVEASRRSRGNVELFPVRFGALRPYAVGQLLLVSFDDVIAANDLLRSRGKDNWSSRLGRIPEHVGFIEAAKNTQKVIEYRSFIIEEMLNEVFRRDSLSPLWRTLALQLGLHRALFDFLTKEDFTCPCTACEHLLPHQTIAYYRRQLQPRLDGKRDAPKSAITVEEVVGETVGTVLQRREGRSELKPAAAARCPFLVFNAMQGVREAAAREGSGVGEFSERMLALEAEVGQVGYSWVGVQGQPLRASVTLRVYLLSIEQEYIEMTLNEDQYARHMLEEIAQMNSLNALYDWALFLYIDGAYTRIPNDEKLLAFADKWGVDLEKTEQELPGSSFFSVNFDSLKRWGQEFWGGKKGKVFLKKWLQFDGATEIAACLANKERYHFLIGEVFGRMKFELMQLSRDEMVTLGALHLLRTHFEKVKHWTEETLDCSLLKDLMPALYHPLLKQDRFRTQLMDCLRTHYGDLAGFQDDRNAVERIYIKILQFLKHNQEWLTSAFRLSTYKASEDGDVLITLTHNSLAVLRYRDRKTLLALPLARLTFKATTHSFFIYEAGDTYRYDGPNTFAIRELIEAYLAYGRLFPSP